MKTLTTPLADLDAAPRDPLASLEWARRTAQEIRRASGGPYRGVPLAPVWGSVPSVAVEQPPVYNPAQSLLPDPKRSTGASQMTPEARGGSDSSNDRADENPRDEMDAKPAEIGDAADDDTDAPPKASASDINPAAPADGDPSDHAHEALAPGRLLAEARDHPAEELPPAIFYDEWDCGRGTYLRLKAAVRLYAPKTGNPAWLREELQSHGATARQIRQQFERLRARRTLCPRQQRGDMLDLAACVDAITARRMGTAPDDRLYIDARPARRGIAISLLVDASGSTNARVTEAWRIIDLEKIALLLATQALDALGDLYAIYAFAGCEASNVKLTVVKDFSESNGDLITRRIAAMTSDGFTRLGAAVRHATRELTRQSAGHRLLLLLSDGRPNDIDAYQGPYGVEDSRQAILEARASGVFPFCLTIDRTASEYLPRIFGRAGHTILRHPEQMPRALLSVVRSLIRQSR